MRLTKVAIRRNILDKEQKEVVCSCEGKRIKGLSDSDIRKKLEEVGVSIDHCSPGYVPIAILNNIIFEGDIVEYKAGEAYFYSAAQLARRSPPGYDVDGNLVPALPGVPCYHKEDCYYVKNKFTLKVILPESIISWLQKNSNIENP